MPNNFRCLCACWHVLLSAQQHSVNSEEAVAVAAGPQEEEARKVRELMNTCVTLNLSRRFIDIQNMLRQHGSFKTSAQLTNSKATRINQ
jgi:hypothetical protein